MAETSASDTAANQLSETILELVNRIEALISAMATLEQELIELQDGGIELRDE